MLVLTISGRVHPYIQLAIVKALYEPCIEIMLIKGLYGNSWEENEFFFGSCRPWAVWGQRESVRPSCGVMQCSIYMTHVSPKWLWEPAGAHLRMGYVLLALSFVIKNYDEDIQSVMNVWLPLCRLYVRVVEMCQSRESVCGSHCLSWSCSAQRTKWKLTGLWSNISVGLNLLKLKSAYGKSAAPPQQ